jgi:hypothetical protein
METTTGMSAPPIAITMWMPKRSAITVMTTSGVSPAWFCAATNWVPAQRTTMRPARLIQWRPGSSMGLPPIFADSLPNAMSEPENVTAPIRTPR